MEQEKISFSIPDNVDFSDLKLARDPDGHLSFEWGVIEKVCIVNKFDPRKFLYSSEENITRFLTSWYEAHLKQGGNPDPVADELKNEVLLEEMFGQTTSYPCGQA